DLPWWVALLLAAVVFTGATFVAPLFAPGGRSPGEDRYAQAGLVLSLPFILVAVAAAVRQWFQRRLLGEQQNLEAIRQLPRQRLEHFIGEAFRRNGCSVTQPGGAAPAGGIDLIVRK